MSRSRIELALRELGPENWSAFEKFAAEFLVVDYPSLRTTASVGGDKGRDGQLYSPTEENNTYVQYSVTTSWASKINSTVATLIKNFGGQFRLIYATNQVIGPAADDLIRDQRKAGYDIDIRDRHWFAERVNTHPQRANAADELAKQLVDPLLAKAGLAPHIARPLDAEEARVALIHLALESVDRRDDQGITRSSFEALVRSTMHDTSAEKTLGIDEIVVQTKFLVPAGDPSQVEAQVRGALNRLTKKGPIKYVRSKDGYHLSFQEQKRLHEHAAGIIALEKDLLEELHGRLASIKQIDPQTERALRVASAMPWTLGFYGEEKHSHQQS